jgi:hypothetical protein
MRWTAHMQECLQEIEARREAPLDDALVQFVRIQLIADKAINSASLDVNIELDSYFRPPPNLFAQEMLAQLGRLRSSMGTATWQEGKLIPSASHQTGWHAALETTVNVQHLTAATATVKLHLHAAEVSITEAALFGDPTVARHSSANRTQYLYACTQAVKQWYEVFFSIPIRDINGITTSTMMQMRHAIGLLYILSTIDEPGWRKEDTSEIVNLYPTLDRLANILSQIPAAVSGQQDADVDSADYADHWWTHVAGTIRTMRTIWAGQDELGNSVVPELISAAFGGDAGTSNDAVDGTELDFPGLDWLMDPTMMSFAV